METQFTYVVWKENDQFVAQCLNVDISSFGDTYEAAVENLNEALELYLEDAPEGTVQPISMPSLLIATKPQTQNHSVHHA